jgi:hypothetical protein
MPISLPAAILGSAGLQAGTSLAGGKKGASAATQASQLQAAAANRAIDLQTLTRQQNVGVLQPFVNYGTSQLGALQNLLGPLTTPTDVNLAPFTFQPTQAQLEQTPGYQFTLDQGLKAAQARAVLEGGGGAAIRGAGTFATGLASQTWPTVFNAELAGYNANTNSMVTSRNMYLQQLGQIYNMMTGQAGIGLGAAEALAGVNQSGSNQIASQIGNLGAAQASGVIGSANALTGGLTGVGNAATGAVGGLTQLAAINAFGQGGGGANPLFGGSVYGSGSGTGGL